MTSQAKEWDKVSRASGGRRVIPRTIRRAYVQLLDICPAIQINHKKLFPAITIAKVPKLKFFKGEIKVCHELSESLLPSAQNNPHAKVTHLGESYSEPLHKTYKKCSKLNKKTQPQLKIWHKS